MDDGHVWLEALTDRNPTVHTYEETIALAVEQSIRSRYYPALKDADPKTNTKPGENSALVHAVSAHSPAQRAGLRAGDLIVAIDGTPIEGAFDVRNRVALTRPGTAMRIRMSRDGKVRTITVKVGEKQ